MERLIDEDDDGYDKDTVNSGIYSITSGAIKFSFKIQGIVFLNKIIILGYTI
jgi:hypothetical protein